MIQETINEIAAEFKGTIKDYNYDKTHILRSFKIHKIPEEDWRVIFLIDSKDITLKDLKSLFRKSFNYKTPRLSYLKTASQQCSINFGLTKNDNYILIDDIPIRGYYNIGVRWHNYDSFEDLNYLLRQGILHRPKSFIA